MSNFRRTREREDIGHSPSSLDTAISKVAQIIKKKLKRKASKLGKICKNNVRGKIEKELVVQGRVVMWCDEREVVPPPPAVAKKKRMEANDLSTKDQSHHHPQMKFYTQKLDKKIGEQ